MSNWRKIATNIMTRKGQSSRYAPRAEVKREAKKKRRREGKHQSKEQHDG